MKSRPPRSGAAADPNAADRLPAYDRARALRATGDSADVADQLLGRFLAELPDTTQRLRAALHEADWDALWALAHRVRGAAAICGTVALAAVVDELERGIKARERGAAEQAIAEFACQVARLQARTREPGPGDR
ncbi:MAG: Hpt domain-containing protein [Gammaproteobacteria bacterium]